MRSEREIDDAIDRAVRDIMSADPSPGFRNRVLTRLERPTSWMTLPRLAASSAALSLVIIAALFFLPRSLTEQPRTVSTAARATDPVPSSSGAPTSQQHDQGTRAAPNSETSPAGGEQRPAESSAAVAFPPRGTVAATSLPAETGVHPSTPTERQGGSAPPAESPASSPGARPSETQARRDGAQPVNIKLDIRIIEQRGAGPPASRTVTMLVRDQHLGTMRRAGNVIVEGKGQLNATLNLEAQPTILESGKIALRLFVEYLPKPESDPAAGGDARGTLKESFNVILEPGKPMTLSQASDPASDSRTAVEITATIQK